MEGGKLGSMGALAIERVVMSRREGENGFNCEDAGVVGSWGEGVGRVDMGVGRGDAAVTFNMWRWREYCWPSLRSSLLYFGFICCIF